MDTDTELKKCLELKRVLEVIIRGCTELHPDYLPLNGLVVRLLLGTVPVINVDCEDGEDGVCQVEGREPIGGLWPLYNELRGVIEALEMEQDFELPSAPDRYIGPEFEI